MHNSISDLFYLFLLLAIGGAFSKDKAALIIVDVQTCFISGGTLPVEDGEAIVPIINELRAKHEPRFDMVILSQDWHCADHVSFASQHQGSSQTVTLQYNNKGDLCQSATDPSPYAVPCDNVTYTVNQILWPDHCVINTTDARLRPDLTRSQRDVVVRKGYHCDVDSYSVFYDNGGFSHTELDSLLKAGGVDLVFIVGLAQDYCVYWSAKDAVKLGYRTFVVLDATRPVDNMTGEAAVKDMASKGISVIQSSELGQYLPSDSDTPANCVGGATSSLLLAAVLAFLHGL